MAVPSPDSHQLRGRSWQSVLSVTPPVFKSFLAGSLSGTCSALLFQPLDVVKTRIQSSIKTGKGTLGIVAAFSVVIKTESMAKLWTGTIPSICRCVPGVGIYFGCLHWIRTSLGIENPGMLEGVLIGASSRTVSGICVLPFTVVKTRFESGEFNYKHMTRALMSIYHTEGLRGLFSGMGPTLFRDVPYSGLYLMFYSQIKHFVPKGAHQEKHPPSIHFCCGMMAGMLASVLTQPADVIKTHMQLYPQKHNRFRQVIAYVYQHDGLVGFLRGVVPRTVKRTLVAAMAWTVYEELMRRMGLTTV